MVMVTREAWFMIFMWENVFDCKIVFLHEAVFSKRSEELLLLDIGVASVWFLGVNSAQILSFQGTFKFKCEET